MLKVKLDSDSIGNEYVLIARGPIGMDEGVHKLPEPGKKLPVIEITLNGAVYHGEHTAEKVDNDKVKVWEILFEKTPNGIIVHHAGEHALYGKNFKAKSERLEDLIKTVPKENTEIAIKESFTAVDNKIQGVLSWHTKNGTIYIKVEDKEIPLFTIRGDKVKVKSINYGKWCPFTVHLLADGREVKITIRKREIIAFWYEENDNVVQSKNITFKKGLQDPKFYIFLELLFDVGDPETAKELMEMMT